MEDYIGEDVPTEPGICEVLRAIADLSDQIAEVRSALAEIVETVTDTVERVKPAIEDLTANPLMKMLAGKLGRN